MYKPSRPEWRALYLKIEPRFTQKNLIAEPGFLNRREDYTNDIYTSSSGNAFYAAVSSIGAPFVIISVCS